MFLKSFIGIALLFSNVYFLNAKEAITPSSGSLISNSSVLLKNIEKNKENILLSDHCNEDEYWDNKKESCQKCDSAF